MKNYNLKLSEYHFEIMTNKLLNQRNSLIRSQKSDPVNKFYSQNEINEINDFFDYINQKFKTQF